jgi:hypothetical protein
MPGKEHYDILYKLRPAVNINTEIYSLDHYLAIDETVIDFSQCFLKQYVPGKLFSGGIRIWRTHNISQAYSSSKGKGMYH